MFTRTGSLREPLFAARLLREEVYLAFLAPGPAAGFAAWCRARNAAPPASAAALAEATRIAAGDELVTVRREHLAGLAAAAGGGAPRTGPGDAFLGRAAPAPEAVPELLRELLETINAPRAVEAWPPPLRAFALHFLLRLVQPFTADPAALGHAGEALLLAADGFDGQHLRLPPPAADPPHARRPDPDAFAADRAHRLLEALAETRDVQREWTARDVLRGYLAEGPPGLGARQLRLLRWLAEGPLDRTLTFDDYVGLHAGRRAPSLRSLQRDWKGLTDAGFLARRGDGGECGLSTAPLRYDPEA